MGKAEITWFLFLSEIYIPAHAAIVGPVMPKYIDHRNLCFGQTSHFAHTHFVESKQKEEPAADTATSGS